MMSWIKINFVALLIVSLLVVCLTFEVWAAAFLGILFAISLNGPAEWMRSEWHLPAWAARLMMLLLVLIVLSGLGFVIGPAIVGQADELKRELPIAMDESLDWLDERKWGRTVVGWVESMSGITTQQLNGEGESGDGDRRPAIGLAQQQPLASEPAAESSQTGHESQAADHAAGDGQSDSAEQPSEDGDDDEDDEDDQESNGKGDNGEDVRAAVLAMLKTVGTMISVGASTVMLLLVSLVIMLYVLLNPDVYRRGILWMIPSGHESVAKLTMAHISVALRWWMLGRLVSMLAVGLLTSLGMWLIGMPAPVALGALAGLLSFVPNIGPIVAAAPGLLIAVPDGSWMFFSALGVYVFAQLIESNLMTPLVDKYTVATPPALLVVTQVIIAVLAGVWGAVIASPLLVVVLVLIQQLYVGQYIKKPIKSSGTAEGESHERVSGIRH